MAEVVDLGRFESSGEDVARCALSEDGVGVVEGFVEDEDRLEHESLEFGFGEGGCFVAHAFQF